MHRRLTTKLLTGIAIALAAAVMAPIASSGSSPSAEIEVPKWLARIQYPGTSSKPTVYMAGGVVIPASLAHLQYPGTSSEPTVYVDTGKSGGAGRHAKAVAPGQIVRSSGGQFDWASFGIGVAAATGLALILAASLLALRRRRQLLHV